MTSSDYVRWFGDLGAEDVASVSGKTASLGELYSALSGASVKVPQGFAITAQAYRDALTAAGAWAPGRRRAVPLGRRSQAAERRARRDLSAQPNP